MKFKCFVAINHARTSDLQNERHIVHLLNLHQSEGKQQQQYEDDENVFGMFISKVQNLRNINFYHVSRDHQASML